LIFGPLGSDDGRRGRLDLPNVEIRGLIKSREMLGRFRDEVDVLLVPMSFDASDRSNTEMNFPSKLADYTAVGLPLLIYGPAYSSAVRWARENYGVAEVVDAENTKWLSQAIHRLATNPAHRAALGARALEVGREYFTLQAAQSVFHDALREHWSRLD